MTSTKPTITWTTSGNVGHVNIDLLKSGTVVQKIAVWATNTGAVNSWTIPTSLASGIDYKIRITDCTYPSVTDVSNGAFTITSGTPSGTLTRTPIPSPSITVITPNGGENWVTGTKPTITWTTSGNVGHVNIDLLKSGAVVQKIACWATNTGAVNSWTVPTSLASGTDYKIRITSCTYPSVTDVSNGAFTIMARNAV